MKEYEYSFKVKNIKPYIDYSKSEGFIKISENKQIRNWYQNDTKINARVTVNIINDTEKIVIDFKEEDCSDAILKNSRESLPLLVDNDMKALNSILDILGYKENVHIERTRIVYKKDTVKFEIDKYIKPEKMCVVAIEGEKVIVDEIYDYISNNIIDQ